MRRLLAITAFVALAMLAVSASEQRQLRGVRPRDVERYSAPIFRCLNGVGSVPSAQVNDEYCDCLDGSDEPGTSACVNSVFYCRNTGAKARLLPSSRVNDGICDCCDGTDEHTAYSKISCPNICDETGRATREALARDVAAAEAGLSARVTLVEKATATREEKRSKLAHYEKVLAERVVLHEQAKAVKEAEEAIEKAERDRRNEEKAKLQAQTVGVEGTVVPDTVDAAQAEVPVPAAPDATAAPTEAAASEAPAAAEENFPYPAEYAYKPAEVEAEAAPAAAEENFPYPAEYAYKAADVAAAEELSSQDDEEEELTAPATAVQEQPVEEEEEKEYIHAGGAVDDAAISQDTHSLGRHLLSLELWSGLWTSLRTPIQDTVEETKETLQEIVEGEYDWPRWRKRWARNSFNAAEYIGWRTIDGLVALGIMDEKEAEHKQKRISTSASSSSAPTPSATSTKAKSGEDDYKTPAAEAARDAFETLDAKLTKLRNKIVALQKTLDTSYGPSGEFMHMDGTCFPLQIKQYTYEVCPYGKAAQKEGHSSTSLGNWEGIEQKPNGQWVMKFAHGQSCWQGPQRSLTVLLQCGAEDKPLTVDEPSKCVYEMKMQTPSVCDARYAAQLKQRQAGGDDEEPEALHVKDEL